MLSLKSSCAAIATSALALAPLARIGFGQQQQRDFTIQQPGPCSGSHAAGEAVLVALDAKTGREVWTKSVADNHSGYYISLAPLVAGGKVMVGVSGGEFGIRGFVAAYDLDSGKELWRTYTVPAPGEPGSETWPKGDQWKTGGGSVWVTGNYDPETDLAYWGIGNGGPWMGDRRPGDNLYTASTIAIDVSTGKIKSHFQYHPNDSWDWDEVSPPILIDYQRNGRSIGAAPGRSTAQSRDRKGGSILSIMVGREELASRRIQSQNPNDLRAGQ